jgi:pimeloyl-ACP methyl ester carboxylesterase
MELQTSRGDFAVLEALPGSGVPERGPALLVPGFTGSKEDFIAVLQTLARSGRRVIAVDLRGQYETPGCEDADGYTCAGLGADVVAMIEAISEAAGEAVHVAGHSFGGLVTREAVLALEAAPDQVRSYTLMSSGPAGLTGPSAERPQALIEALPLLGMATIWDIHLGPEALDAGTPPEIVEFLKARSLANDEAGLLAMAHELLSCPDRVEQLAKVAADAGLPLLVLYGEDDDVWHPRTQAAMAERLRAAKVVLPGAAHSPAVDAPETTAHTLTDFWNAAERTHRQ